MSWNEMSQCEKKENKDNDNSPTTGFIFFMQIKIIAIFLFLN